AENDWLQLEDTAAPIAAIAERAGVSRATFYRHFGSRASLLHSVAIEPRPVALKRILGAAKDMLITRSVAELSMDALAVAAGVSRGTLYRVYPGKAALLRGLILEYSPFEAIGVIVAEHREDPPQVVLPLIGRAIVGVAGERLGLMRAMFHEITSGSPQAFAGMRSVYLSTFGVLAEYMTAQMAAGRIRPMHPILALQAVIGPIFFHLMTRPTIERLVGLPMDAQAAVDELMAAALEGIST
ncbi:MAG: TetR family transcriptional regulator, partial [Chloroflexi bacterium]|nr:TetR family transcriptional regulator [Chloroflexota bacterium]